MTLTLCNLMETHIGHKGATSWNAILQQGGILAGAEEFLIAEPRPARSWIYDGVAPNGIYIISTIACCCCRTHRHVLPALDDDP